MANGAKTVLDCHICTEQGFPTPGSFDVSFSDGTTQGGTLAQKDSQFPCYYATNGDYNNGPFPFIALTIEDIRECSITVWKPGGGWDRYHCGGPQEPFVPEYSQTEVPVIPGQGPDDEYAIVTANVPAQLGQICGACAPNPTPSSFEVDFTRPGKTHQSKKYSLEQLWDAKPCVYVSKRQGGQNRKFPFIKLTIEGPAKCSITVQHTSGHRDKYWGDIALGTYIVQQDVLVDPGQGPVGGIAKVTVEK